MISKACRGCVYFRGSTRDLVGTCDYFLITGKRRPCEAGDGCTVKLTEGDSKMRIQAEQVAELVGKGKKPDEIASILKCSNAAVYNHLKRMRDRERQQAEREQLPKPAPQAAPKKEEPPAGITVGLMKKLLTLETLADDFLITLPGGQPATAFELCCCYDGRSNASCKVVLR